MVDLRDLEASPALARVLRRANELADTRKGYVDPKFADADSVTAYVAALGLEIDALHAELSSLRSEMESLRERGDPHASIAGISVDWSVGST